MKVHYNEKYLKRRYQHWSLAELKYWLKELEEKLEKKTIKPDEALCVQPVREEIQRRTKKEV